MTVLPAIRRALRILECADRPDLGTRTYRQDMINRIQRLDPYPDKRFAPVLAKWKAEYGLSPEEHAEDVVQFKSLRKRLKDLRVPATNPERKLRVRELLSRGPDDFATHYSALQEWNREVSNILDPDRDLSDAGLPVVMRYNGYTMYRIDTWEHCQVPLVKNTMGWCVTKGAFGSYGGPPYYPVVRDHDMEPFCMVIPAYFVEDKDQAVRNAHNNSRLSAANLSLIRPLVQHVLPLGSYGNRYILGIHGFKPDLSIPPSSASNAFHMMRDYAICPGEWPLAEDRLSKDPEYAYHYALTIIGGPWPAGEEAISQNAQWAHHYAIDVIRGRWLPGEAVILKDVALASAYAIDVIKGRWPEAEGLISTDPDAALAYARYVIRGRWPEGEQAISRNTGLSLQYAVSVLKDRFPLGEPAIALDGHCSCAYAENMVYGDRRFRLGEAAISRSASCSFQYARNIIRDRWQPGEAAIAKDPYIARRYQDEVMAVWRRGYDGWKPVVISDARWLGEAVS